MIQGRRWIEAAGGSVLDDGNKETGVEISPLVVIPRDICLW